MSLKLGNLHKEYAEKGALFVDACRDSPKTGTGKLIKRMMEVEWE